MKIKYIIMLIAFLIIFVLSRICEKEVGFPVFNQENNSETMLIIDAGHGGLDGGAVGFSGICEQDITLSISTKAHYLCGFLGINSMLTRENTSSLDYNPSANIRENKVSDTRARTELVNSIDNSFLVSVHLNSFTDSKYHGAQVFFNNYPISETFANLLQSEIKNNLDFSNERQALVAPNSVYLIENANCPAIIYECGFLSNENEEKLLSTNEYQTKLAVCMITSYLKIQKELQNETKDSVLML